MSNKTLLTQNPGSNDVAANGSLNTANNVTVSMEFAIEEDIEAELEEFSQLVEKGALVQAFAYFDDVLKEHLHLFPVLAEFADLLIECRDYDRLKDVLNTLPDTFVGEEQLIVDKFRALAEIGTTVTKAAKRLRTPELLNATTTSQSWPEIGKTYDRMDLVIEALQKAASFCLDESIVETTSIVSVEQIKLSEVKDKRIPMFNIILQVPSVPVDDWQLHCLELHYRIAILVIQLFAIHRGVSPEVSKACHQVFTVSVDTIKFLLDIHNSRQALRMLDVVMQVTDSASTIQIAERAIRQSVRSTPRIPEKLEKGNAIVKELRERWANGRMLFGADNSAFWSANYLRQCVQRNDTVAMRRWATLVDDIDLMIDTWTDLSIPKPAEKVSPYTMQELFHGVRRCRDTDLTGWQAFVNKALIDCGTNPDAAAVVLEEGAQNTAEALHTASKLGSREIVALLLNRVDGPELLDGLSGASAISAAAAGGHIELVADLLNYGVDPDRPAADGQTAIEQAAMNGHRNVMELLLSSGAKLVSVTGFINAAERGHVGVVRLLLDNGVQIGRPGRHAMTLGSVAREGHTEVVELLLLQSTVEGRNSALKTAALFGYAEIVQRLLDYGVDINHRDDRGRVAIELAASRDDVDVMKVLVARGANIKDMESALEIVRKSDRYAARAVEAVLQKAIAAHYENERAPDGQMKSADPPQESERHRASRWASVAEDF